MNTDFVMDALLACWKDPVLMAKVHTFAKKSFIRILDLADFIDERHDYQGTLTVFPVEAVLRDVPLKIVTQRGYGTCVELDAFKIAKKIDVLRNGQPDAAPTPPVKAQRKRRSIWK